MPATPPRPSTLDAHVMHDRRTRTIRVPAHNPGEAVRTPEAIVSGSTLQALYDLAYGVTREKIKTINIEFWQDEHQAGALCTYTFQGWISNFTTGSGGGGNHILSLSLQPAPDGKNFINVAMGN